MKHTNDELRVIEAKDKGATFKTKADEEKWVRHEKRSDWVVFVLFLATVMMAFYAGYSIGLWSLIRIVLH